MKNYLTFSLLLIIIDNRLVKLNPRMSQRIEIFHPKFKPYKMEEKAMSKASFIMAIVLVIFLFGQSFTVSAGTTGKIAGLIKDSETGEWIPGVNVVIEGTTLGAAADMDGRYVILNIHPGNYVLRVMAIGYTTKRVEGVRVSVGLTTKIDVTLSSEVIEMQEVVVSASRPVIEMDRTNTAAYMAAEEISELPVTEIEQLVQLQAGVTQDSEGELHFRGGRSGEVAYLVDGVPITNRFDGGSSIEIENAVIQELQVISGTFNAEYGQAQSGIINVISKAPKAKYSGRVSAYGGAHISNNTDVFPGIDELQNNTEADFQANLSGPVPFSDKLSFYGFVRYNKSDGWINGERRYKPTDSWKIRAFEQWYNLNYPERQFGQFLPYSTYADSLNLYTGDNNFSPMNPSEKLSFNGKLFFQITPGMRVFYNGFYDRGESKVYDNSYRFTPGAVPTTHKNAFTHTLNLTHTLTSNAFYELNLSYYGEKRETYLYENNDDSRYQTMVPSLMGYRFGGTNNRNETVNFQTMLAKMDMTWQVDNTNLVKFGFSAKQFDVDYKEVITTNEPNSHYLPNVRWTTFDEYYALSNPPTLWVPGTSTLLNNQYEHKPIELAVYAQDKLELGELIANVGLRFDYFEPDGTVPVNPRAKYNAVEGRLETSFKEASVKYQLSPRLGLAFPISDRGVIHASYGHFLQIPQFQYLYFNSEFEISSGFKETIMGNSDLEPERTVGYEVGLQQQLSDDLGIDLTIYSKDIRNLLGQEILDTIDERVYFRYINRDYGNVKGITLSLEKRPVGFLSGRIDYTLQIARGNASDPNAVFINNQSTRPVETQKQVIPLNWDETHILNGTLRLGKPSSWAVSLIGRLGSGLPYTPETPQEMQIETQFENSERKPMRSTVDIYAQKYLKLGDASLVLFARVFNLFDRKNQLNVFPSTGFADRRFRRPEQERIDAANGVYTLQEIDNRPQWYSEPRKVQLGLALEF